MTKYILSAFVVWSLLVAVSCNEREIIIPPFEPVVSDRVVLVEEVTGVRCPNCPSGSAKIESLLEQFPEQVVAVAIHGDFLTVPYNESKFDLRNEFASDLENYLKPWEGKPAAFVNRTKFDDEPLTAIGEFDLLSSYVSEELNKAHRIELFLSSAYNATTRNLELNLGILPLEDISGEFRINVMLTESKIIDRQANVGSVIEAYEHNHVLRMMLTPFDGEPFTDLLQKDDLSNHTFTFTVPVEDEIWNVENMYVVAFVSNHDGDLKEVIQAKEITIL